MPCDADAIHSMQNSSSVSLALTPHGLLDHEPGLSLPSGLLGIPSLFLNTPCLPFCSGVPKYLFDTGLALALSPLTCGEGLEGILELLPLCCPEKYPGYSILCLIPSFPVLHPSPSEASLNPLS